MSHIWGLASRPLLLPLGTLLVGAAASAQVGGAGYVASWTEVSFCVDPGAIQVGGLSSAGIGDLDGDGIADLATQSGTNQDTVSVNFMNADGSVRSSTLFGIGGQGGFVGDIAPLEHFADELSSLGDLDGDGVVDMLVGHDYDDDGSGNPGALWVVFLNPDGTVKNQQKISAEVGGLTIPPGNNNHFGEGLATLGDIDGDGIQDIAVGAPEATQISNGGVVHILTMNRDGTVKTQSIVGWTGTLLGEQISFGDAFGQSIAGLGDLDGDGVPDMAVGAIETNFGTGLGSVWIVFLTPSGGVKGFTRITQGTPGFGATLSPGGQFGWEVTNLGDLNADGVTDIAASANRANSLAGEVYELFLDPTGGVLGWQVFREGELGFDADLQDAAGALGCSMDVYSPASGANGLVLAVGAGVECSNPYQAQFLVTLDDGQRAITYEYGDGVNPTGSLRVLSGEPSSGTTLQVGVDNPLGTQSPGGVPFLVLSVQPDPSFPAGTPIPGLGMAGGGAAGELLVSLAGQDLLPFVLFGAPWAGPGQPSPIDVAIPGDPTLQGLLVFAQGVLPDPSAGAGGVRFGLTSGLELRLGP